MRGSIAVLVVLLACAVPALAEDEALKPYGIRVLASGITAAPVRAVADWLGATLTYKAADGAITMTKDGKAVALRLYLTDYTVDATPAKLAAPFARDGVAYAPVRALVEPFGCMVSWERVDEEEATVGITRKGRPDGLSLRVIVDLQTISADFDGDGTRETAYCASLNSSIGAHVVRPCIGASMWITRGRREVSMIPNLWDGHFAMRARDITGDGNPDLILEGEYWGSGVHHCFDAFGWRGHEYGPLLAEGTLYHSGMGDAFVLPQGGRKPARLATIDIVFDNQHRPDCFVANWYDWDGHQFVRTRTRTTRKNHGIDCEAACRELGLPKPG